LKPVFCPKNLAKTCHSSMHSVALSEIREVSERIRKLLVFFKKLYTGDPNTNANVFKAHVIYLNFSRISPKITA